MTFDEKLKKKYRRDMFIAVCWYLGLIYVSQWILWFIRSGPSWAKALVALTPMIGVAVMLQAIIRLHRASDELQRRIHSEAAIISAVIVGLSSFALGLVQAAINPRVQPTVWSLWVGPALIGIWGLAKSVLTRRFR